MCFFHVLYKFCSFSFSVCVYYCPWKSVIFYGSLLTVVNSVYAYHFVLINIKISEGSVKFSWRYISVAVSYVYYNYFNITLSSHQTSCMPWGKVYFGWKRWLLDSCPLHLFSLLCTVYFISWTGWRYYLTALWLVSFALSSPRAITLLYSVVVQLTTLSPPCIICSHSLSLSLFQTHTHTILIIFHFSICLLLYFILLIAYVTLCAMH